MKLKLIGINHNTASIEIREEFYLNQLQQDLFLSELKSRPSVVEAFILSTCNRTEIYVHTIDERTDTHELLQLIKSIKNEHGTMVGAGHFYELDGLEAVEHLLRVSTGLDSLVLGEKQILGQMKSSVERARTRGLFSKNFNILTNIAIRAGKKAQSETNISQGGSSISWAAIETAKKYMGELKDKSVLIIGAGKMSELALTQMRNKGINDLYLINRTHSKAVELAGKYQGIASDFCDIKEIMSKVDICFCSASAPHYILDKSTIQKIVNLRNQKDLLLIDISMPRNIDPEVASIDHVRLLAIDDLKGVVDSNIKIREQAIGEVESIIKQKLIEFKQKLSRLQPEYTTS